MCGLLGKIQKEEANVNSLDVVTDAVQFNIYEEKLI